MTGMLVFLHCGSNSGYAITRLERVFLDVARRLVGDDANIHFAFTTLDAGRPEALPAEFSRVLQFDPRSDDATAQQAMETYVREHGIRLALGFDQPVRRAGYAALRRGGVQTFVSYWGAPMSSVHRGLTLALKRLDVRLARHGPDHYVFESAAMQRTAVQGRGIASARTSVTYLGVDPAVFHPAPQPYWYAHDVFGIPRDRRIIYYSGHMEERKGVHVLVKAAVDLVGRLGVRDVHFLFLGNRPGEAELFDALYRGSAAEPHITFGGYRQDVEQIIPGCHVGAIASTGWDSFTMSSLEMAACGLPLIVSNLPGLDETVEEGLTGHTFPVGDHRALAERLAALLADPAGRDAMSRAARARVESRFTIARQVESLVATIRAVDAGAVLDGRPA